MVSIITKTISKTEQVFSHWLYSVDIARDNN